MGRLEVNFGKLKLQNPVVVASGTFGYGLEVKELIDVEKLGAITTKTITLEPRIGNPLPRILETPSGLLNSIGLQNIGLEMFEKKVLNEWKNIKNVKLFVSIGGNNVDEYVKACERLNSCDRIDAFELNISCPNVKEGCLAIGQDRILLEKLIKNCKKATDKTLIVKISPSFSDIASLSKKIEDFGADAICMTNTFLGTKIDIAKKTFYFKNKIAGFSGPAIKPLALKLLLDVRSAVKIPVIGMGGIASADDALEFLIAGANLISIGTMNFRNPKIGLEIVSELENYCLKNKLENISEIIGSLK